MVQANGRMTTAGLPHGFIWQRRMSTIWMKHLNIMIIMLRRDGYIAGMTCGRNRMYFGGNK